MRKVILIMLGLIALVILVSAGTVIVLKNGAHGFSARADPSAFEVTLAGTARSLAMPAEARDRRNPVPRTQEGLEEGMAHWADHCAVCHGNDGAGQVDMGKQMYPHAPDMRKAETQNLTDGELFYIIENGIRLSGMPAWGGSKTSEESSWKLVNFIRHLPKLSDAEIRRMEKLNPKSPEDIEREQAEEQFLNGQIPNEVLSQHHH